MASGSSACSPSKLSSGVFVRDYATWHVLPKPFEHQNWYKCSVSSAEGRCRILDEDEEEPEDALVFEFPHDYLSEFQRDPAGATRDLAGIALDTYAPFISKREAIEEMFEPDWPHLFDQREWEMGRPLVVHWSKTMAKVFRPINLKESSILIILPKKRDQERVWGYPSLRK